MTLRRRIAERVAYLAGLRDFATFFETTKFPYHAPEFTLTYVVRPKAEADKIIASFAPAARPLWRNGIYMAELERPDSALRRDPMVSSSISTSRRRSLSETRRE